MTDLGGGWRLIGVSFRTWIQWTICKVGADGMVLPGQSATFCRKSDAMKYHADNTRPVTDR